MSIVAENFYKFIQPVFIAISEKPVVIFIIKCILTKIWITSKPL